jgi:hypothetical protein
MSTTYQELRKKVNPKRGRKPLPEDERKRRAEARKIELRRKMEAKRRAWFVLENKYKDEFERLFAEEYEALKKSKYAETADNTNSKKK